MALLQSTIAIKDIKQKKSENANKANSIFD